MIFVVGDLVLKGFSSIIINTIYYLRMKNVRNFF